MRINLAGLWRILIVVYGLYAVIVLGFGTVAGYEAWTCPERRATAQAEQLVWERSPPCDQLNTYIHCDAAGKQVFGTYVPTCADSVLVYLGIMAAALAGGAVILFGGGVVVRWIYRGLVSK
jgi:hypothetical protein